MNLKDMRVLVTGISFGKNDPTMKPTLEAAVGEVIYNTTGKPYPSTELRKLLPGIDGYIAGLDVVDRSALDTADRLKVIARYGVGVDNVDLAAAREKGIIVTNTPGANSVAVAELTIGLILSVARHIPAVVDATRCGEWPRNPGFSLSGKTIGILGIGRVGRQVARRLAGFDCRIVTYDPNVSPESAIQYGAEHFPNDEVIAMSDIVSLHMPLLPDTRGLVNAEFISKMKTGAMLINTARGEIVDDQALIDALDSGKLMGAAMDVFSTEPPDPENPLLHMKQVILTPHCGAQTDGATNAMGWMSLQGCLAVLSGHEPKYPVLNDY